MKSGQYLCPAGVWTKIAESPSLGFLFIDTEIPASVRWRRYADGIPWYNEGSLALAPGQNTLVHGGPSVVARIEVLPNVDVVLFPH